MRRFAFVLAGKHGFFARDDGRIKIRGIEGERICRRDMQSDQASERRQLFRIRFRLQGNEDADFAEAFGDRVMDILANETLPNLHGSSTPQCHIFANRGDGVGDRIAERPATWIGNGFQSFDIGGAGFDGKAGDVSCQPLEIRVPCHEIRFRIDLNDDPVGATDKNRNEPFGSNPAGFLGGLGKPLLAQPVDRRFYIALCFTKGILAIHHASAGLLAKILHHRSSDVRHIGFPSSSRKLIRTAG